MRFLCPICKGIVSVDNVNAGKNVACGHCQQEITVPKDNHSPGVVIGDFVIEKELARGGMGIVFLAKQISLDRMVALKVLMSKYTEDVEFIQQFVQEARAAAKLNHPNVVQAYAVGEEDGVYYFAMEFVDGKTMKQVLAENGKINELDAAKIIKDVADALDFAWTEFKIVHQDIKPDNIMLTQKGRAKLADLGLAKAGEVGIGDDDHDEVLGTPQYISPEQLLGEKTDVRSDIYSLGATFYHLITGTFPYTGSSANDLAKQHVDGVLEPPKVRDASISTEANDIIVKMMSKDITKRYQSGSELSKALSNFIDNYNKPKTTTGRASSFSLNRTATTSQSTVNAPKLEMKAPKLEMKRPSLGSTTSGSVKAPVLTTNSTKNSTSQTSDISAPMVPKMNPPTLGLKKKEEPKAEPKVDPVNAENKDANAKTDKKDATSKSGKAKPKSKEVTKKSPVGLIVGVVLLVVVGAGVWWKLDLIKSYLNKNKSGTTTTTTTTTVTNPPPKAPVIPVIIERTYIVELRNLKKFIEENPTRELDFLRSFDDFLQKYPNPQNTEERILFAEVIPTYNIIDERQRISNTRERLKQEHLRDVKNRQELAKRAADELVQQKATEVRIAEDAKRKAEQEAERQKKLAEEKAALEKQIAEYTAKVAPAVANMKKLFWDSVKDSNKKAELSDYVKTLDKMYPLRKNPDLTEVKFLEELKVFGNELVANVDETNKMYKVFVGANNKFKGLNFEYRVGDMVMIEEPFCEKHYLMAKNTKRRDVKVDLNNDVIRAKIFRIITRNDKIENLEFYYQLFFNYNSDKLAKIAPNQFWKKFFYQN